ncbi:MAG: glycosyltransferase family 4 protein [Anaerolineae bacterium]|nr:glycosyltransferase family 4 protein [Anaerolineae bacterium]
MKMPTTAILHYAAPPIVGGVEAVIHAHAAIFIQNDYPVTVVAGRGDQASLPSGTGFMLVPEIDSQHPEIIPISTELEQGRVPSEFEGMTDRLVAALDPVLEPFDCLIVHNIFTKHFNLPLSAALYRLLDAGKLRHCIAWCHDFTWTSPNSRPKVHDGYPWDLLRTYRQDVTYVVVSQRRQRELASLLGCSAEHIHVIYNGVDPAVLLGWSAEGRALISRLGILESDLALLMPVRVTQAKNIEYALHVVAALKAQGAAPKLVLTGPPDPHDPQIMAYFQELKALRKELDVEEEARFVYESGPSPDEPFTIGPDVVGDLFRACDVMFMPSHREGFGMPVLEAGLAGLPVVCTNVPVAEEIGGDDVIFLAANEGPTDTAARLLVWAEHSTVHHLRRRVRQEYTWQALFHQKIEPLLKGSEEQDDDRS